MPVETASCAPCEPAAAGRGSGVGVDKDLRSSFTGSSEKRRWPGQRALYGVHGWTVMKPIRSTAARRAEGLILAWMGTHMHPLTDQGQQEV